MTVSSRNADKRGLSLLAILAAALVAVSGTPMYAGASTEPLWSPEQGPPAVVTCIPIDTPSPLVPRLEAGLELAPTETFREMKALTGLPPEIDQTLVYRLGAGVEYPIGGEATFDLGYDCRLDSGTDPLAAPGVPLDIDSVNHRLSVGVRVNF